MPEETQLAVRTVKEYLELPAYKARFGEVLGNRAPQFMASLIQLTGDPYLAKCEPKSVIASAMIAAILDFPIEKSLGFAHIVPYAGVAQFQMAAKGYVQLALRSGQYQRLNAKPVNAEAIGSYDEVGEPEINWSLLDETKPAVGYVVAWKLVNGFVKRAYWSKAKVEDHASRYSQAYKKKKMDSPWFTNFDKMAIKTVLMNELRTYGPLSVQMQTAMKHDYAVHTDIDAEPQYIDNNEGVTGTVTADEPQVARPAAPPRAKKGAAAVVENTPPANTPITTKGNVVEGEFTDNPAAAKKAEDEKLAADMAEREAKLKAAQPKVPITDKAAAEAMENLVKEGAPPERTPAQQKILDDLRVKQEQAIKAKAEAAAPQGLTSLKDGEEVTVVATIQHIQAMPGTYRGKENTPLVQADLVGGFVGHVYHWEGGVIDKKNNVTPHELYVPGAQAKFTLLGRINKATKVVNNLVTKIEAASDTVPSMD